MLRQHGLLSATDFLGTEIWKVLLKVRGKNTTPPQPPKNDLNWSNSVSFGMKL